MRCLPSVPGIAVVEAQREDRLLDLALDLAVWIGHQLGVEEPHPDELLADGRSAGDGLAGLEVLEHGPHDAAQVDARVGPERLVLGGHLRVDHDLRHLLEADLAPILHGERGELVPSARAGRSSPPRGRSPRSRPRPAGPLVYEPYTFRISGEQANGQHTEHRQDDAGERGGAGPAARMGPRVPRRVAGRPAGGGGRRVIGRQGSTGRPRGERRPQARRDRRFVYSGPDARAERASSTTSSGGGMIADHTDLDALRAATGGRPGHLLRRVRPDRAEPPLRQPRPARHDAPAPAAGHRPIGLVGGATGLVGDPSGRTSERTLNEREVIGGWVERIRSQVERYLDFEGPDPARSSPTTSTGPARCAPSTGCATSASTSASAACWPRSRSARAWRPAASATPSSATRSCRRSTSSSCIAATAAPSSSAAATSGATSPPAST